MPINGYRFQFCLLDLPCLFVVLLYPPSFCVFKLVQETPQMPIGSKMNKACSSHTVEHGPAVRTHVL